MQQDTIPKPLSLHLKLPTGLPTGLPKLTKQSVNTVKISTKSIDSLLLENTQNEEAFFICDLTSVTNQYSQWIKYLPRIKPYYAVKCNPDQMILKTLEICGTGFDCASRGEITSILPNTDIIYANPCKQSSHITFATQMGINRMTFDNHDELFKIVKFAPKAECVLRILTDDSKSVCRFGVKFGAGIAVVPSLLVLARELKLNVVGVSFHVGSGCFDETSFTDAVVLARKVFDIGAGMGFDFKLLDIGGGFPGKSFTGLQFPQIASVLGPCIDKLFPENVKVIAEPGRYFVSHAFTLAVQIIARRVVDGEDGKEYMYYVNEGMYGAFNNLTFDHAKVTLKPLLSSKGFKDRSGPFHKSSVWGPTCDSIDLIARETLLPELRVGDWLVCEEMGAYTSAAASNFNGFSKAKVVYTHSSVSGSG